MAEFSFPFTGDAGGDDGPYAASFFAGMMSAVFGQDNTARNDASYILRTDNGTDDVLEVTETSPQSNEIEIKKGKALIKGYYYYNDSDLNIVVSANNNGSGFDRIDTVVLEIDFINQVVRAKIIEGTPAGSPVAPTLTKDATLWQVPLADILVQNLFTVIVNADIDNTVKIPYILWDVTQGGTGITGVAVGELIAGTGTNTFGNVNPAINYGKLIGDTSEPTDMDWVEQRVGSVYGTSSTTLANGLGGTVINTDSKIDPAGLITLAGSNQFQVQAGDYEVFGFVNLISNDGTTHRAVLWWLYNVTTTTIIAQSEAATVGMRDGASNVGVGTGTATMSPKFITSNGTDLFELRGYTTANGVVDATNTNITPTGGSASYARSCSFRKLQN